MFPGMPSLSLRNAVLGLVVLATVTAAPSPATAQETRHHRAHAHWHSRPEAVQALRLLRAGGNVLFFRHAKTEMLAKDGDGTDWDDCSWQRNLSPMGREAAREMGEAFRLLEIPVGEVLSSPYCRCMDTAQLAFGRVQAVPALAPSASGPPGSGMRAAGQALRELLARDVPPGTNTVVVAHIFNALGALGRIPEEGEAFVIRCNAAGELEIVATVTMTQWGDLVRDLRVFGLDPDHDARAAHAGHQGPGTGDGPHAPPAQPGHHDR